MQRTEISSYGEFGLIKHLTEKFKLQNASTQKGVGDDAAVLHYGEKQVLVTTDLLLEGIHFDFGVCPTHAFGI
jgi:thiamine-monophosphate kinase